MYASSTLRRFQCPTLPSAAVDNPVYRDGSFAHHPAHTLSSLPAREPGQDCFQYVLCIQAGAVTEATAEVGALWTNRHVLPSALSGPVFALLESQYMLDGCHRICPVLETILLTVVLDFWLGLGASRCVRVVMRLLPTDPQDCNYE